MKSKGLMDMRCIVTWSPWIGLKATARAGAPVAVKGGASKRMLKKSIHGFFNNDLAGVNPSKSHKLHDFSSLAIWQSIRGLPGYPPAGWVGAFFNTLLKAVRHVPLASSSVEKEKFWSRF